MSYYFDWIEWRKSQIKKKKEKNITKPTDPSFLQKAQKKKKKGGWHAMARIHYG